MNDPANRLCFDCGSQNVTHCSINNGIILCPGCAERHYTLNRLISTVKGLTEDSWTSDELMFLEMSGNKRFANMMQEFKIPIDKGFDFKYSTIAAYYYRKLVYSELQGTTPPVRPDISAGFKIMTEDMLQEPGFFQNMKSRLENIGEKIKDVFTSSKKKEETTVHVVHHHS